MRSIFNKTYEQCFVMLGDEFGTNMSIKYGEQRQEEEVCVKKMNYESFRKETWRCYSVKI